MATERETLAISRIPNHLSDASNLAGLIRVCASMFDDFDTVLEYLAAISDLDQSEGVWLDKVGDIVGSPRASGQRADEEIFTYSAVSDFPGQAALGYSSSATLLGGHYNSVNGLPTGVLIADADFRSLIRAKIYATYSDTSLAAIFTWIYKVFGVTCVLDESYVGEIAVDLDSYITHYQRRLLLAYAPRAAGVRLWLRSFPAMGSEYEILGTSESLTLDTSMPRTIVVAETSGLAAVSGESGGVYGSGTLSIDDDGYLTITGEESGIEINLGNAFQYPAFYRFVIRNTVDYVVPIKMFSGATLLQLYPNAEVSLILLDPSSGPYGEGYDGEWHALGIGANFADLAQSDLRGANSTTTASCAAGGTVTGSIALGVIRGVCLELTVTGTVADSDIVFYADSARTVEVYRYDSADCTGPFVDPINWSIAPSDSVLTDGLIYYSVTNNHVSSASKYEIEMLIHGQNCIGGLT